MSWLLGTIATEIGSTFADMNLAGAVAADLEDDELLLLLARAAKAVYNLGGKSGHGIKLTKIQGEMSAFYGADGGHSVQYGLYEITEGCHEGETILAFRGTDLNLQQVLQDLSMIISGPHITEAVHKATRIAKESRPTWLTGHSLGGFLAECVCSQTAIPGASFAAPGPVGHVSQGSHLIGQQHHKVEWKTVINRNDTIATTIGGIGGSQSSHIVRSKNILWLDFGGSRSLDERLCGPFQDFHLEERLDYRLRMMAERHSMQGYIEHLG